VHDTIGFKESVERMCCPGLALAPTAMAGMNDQWRSNQTISDLPASASAFHVWLHHSRLGVWPQNNWCSLLLYTCLPETHVACSARHSRTKFPSIPFVFGPMSALQ
jgi:hypothetical protein